MMTYYQNVASVASSGVPAPFPFAGGVAGAFGFPLFPQHAAADVGNEPAPAPPLRNVGDDAVPVCFACFYSFSVSCY